MRKKELAKEVIERLKKEYPDAGCSLEYDQAWKLLVSVRLAAQCTDARVNIVVEKLYEKFPDVKALADPNSTPQTFGRPGHINPLYAQDNGVLRRSGHTEAAIDLCKMAGLYPAGALMEIMNEDGTMARLPELMKMAQEWNLKVISIKDMIEYRLKKESLIEVGEEVDMPTEYGHFRLIPFRQSSNGLEHMALIKGEWKEDEPILVRVHSSCATGDILGSKRCDCGQQLHKAMQMIDEAGKGVVVYMHPSARSFPPSSEVPKVWKTYWPA